MIPLRETADTRPNTVTLCRRMCALAAPSKQWIFVHADVFMIFDWNQEPFLLYYINSRCAACCAVQLALSTNLNMTRPQSKKDLQARPQISVLTVCRCNILSRSSCGIWVRLAARGRAQHMTDSGGRKYAAECWLWGWCVSLARSCGTPRNTHILRSRNPRLPKIQIQTRLPRLHDAFAPSRHRLIVRHTRDTSRRSTGLSEISCYE